MCRCGTSVTLAGCKSTKANQNRAQQPAPLLRDAWAKSEEVPAYRKQASLRRDGNLPLQVGTRAGLWASGSGDRAIG